MMTVSCAMKSSIEHCPFTTRWVLIIMVQDYCFPLTIGIRLAHIGVREKVTTFFASSRVSSLKATKTTSFSVIQASHKESRVVVCLRRDV